MNEREKLDNPLWDSQIRKFGFDVLPYKDIKIRTLEKFLDTIEDGIVVLYQNTPNSGHYCCIFENDKGLFWFDPYGVLNNVWLMADSQLKWTGFKKYSGKSKILKFMDEYKKRGGKVFGNDIKYQKDDPSRATCGYHCLMRLIFSFMDEDEYFRFMKNIKKKTNSKDFDELVVKLLKNYI